MAAQSHSITVHSRTSGPGTKASRVQDRCTSGHFLQAGDTHCHVDGCRAPRRPRLSLVKPIPPLPRRDRAATTTAYGRAEGRAASDGLARRLPTFVLKWKARPDGGADQYLADGTLLHHPGSPGAPFTALVTCPRGAHHEHLVLDAAGLDLARRRTAACDQAHADLTTITAPTYAELTAAFAARRNTVVPLHKMPQTKEA